ncbi:pyridoxamine 5'-phosphate oxidase family protein [Phaeobacter sp. C3_T13_0]|uniref:FAD-binding oxidoreductase n=1 Tax=Phaeobacter cretensis TaxID=3342641 RepID=UPI0039BC3429
MSTQDRVNPFHDGELQAQIRAGVGDVATWAGGFIRDFLPDQHRTFHTSLPFLVVSGADTSGRTWVTMVDGAEGFVTSPDPQTVTLDTDIDATDPLFQAFQTGTDIGVLGIELASRRRNRFSGRIRAGANGYTIDIYQTFGNCPQYIHERTWTRAAKNAVVNAQYSDALTNAQIALITASDTMFVGSGHNGRPGAASNGFDASHRGGAPGFVHILDGTHLQIPDYAGNNFFNTIGNLVSNPRIGLMFVDFDTGGLLHVSGRTTIDWDPKGFHDPDALRVINVEIDAVLERSGAVGLRWAKQDHLARHLKLVRRETESDSITSFYFEPCDGRPLQTFEAGQHLPIEVQIPKQTTPIKRNYSLSGSPKGKRQYRISVKREDKGVVSRFLHDILRPGNVIKARNPSGGFVIPCYDCPLVLVSAGVGLTPMISALHASAQQQDRIVWFVHGARSGADHAFRGEVDQLVAGNENLHCRTYYSEPGLDDVLGLDYSGEGRVTAKRLFELNAGPAAQYMLCGPAAFLADICGELEAGGVPADHIHFETFGPTG